MEESGKKKFIQLWFILGIVAGFAAILFFTVTYLNQRILCNLDCRTRNEVAIVLVLVALVGMFIGSLTYYFISEKYEKKITRIHKDVNSTLRFLDGQERTIVKALLSKDGELTQSDLVRDTGLSRVKIFRSLKKLEQKRVVTKKPNGMTNIITLEKDLKNILLE